MAGLNLVPNIGVLAVQTGVFMANVYVIRKLWLNPYLKVHKIRQEKTSGAHSEAEQTNHENEKLVADIETAITDAVEKSRQSRISIQENYSLRRDKIISAAATEAQEISSSSKDQLTKEIEQEFKKIPDIIKKLSDDFYSKILTQ